MINNIITFIKSHIPQTVICILIAALVSGLFIFNALTKDKDPFDDLHDTVLFSSGNYTMTYDEAYFLTKNKQAYYEAYYLIEGYTLNWNAVYEDNKTFEEVVLEESLNYAKEVFLFSEYAKKQGITLTDEEKNSIANEVEAFFEDSNEKIIDATRVNKDILTRVYTRAAYHDKLCDKIYSETDLTVNSDDVRQCLVAAVELSPKYFDSPDRTANAIMERVNAGEVITSVADIYDVEALKGNVGNGDMDGNALEELCMSLKDGECKTTEIDGTYFVVYCYLANDEDATAEAKKLKTEELKADAVASYMEELEKDMTITVDIEAWSTINFDKTIFTEEDMASLSTK